MKSISVLPFAIMAIACALMHYGHKQAAIYTGGCGLLLLFILIALVWWLVRNGCGRELDFADEPEMLLLTTKYKGELMTFKAPDQDGEVYVNVKDSDGVQVSTYLPSAQVKRLAAFVNRIS